MISSVDMLAAIRDAEQRLTARYEGVLLVNRELDRTLVSFQANKAQTVNRWYKYKEGFSTALMRYVFERTGIAEGHILDPFAGSGTALFAAAEEGIDATGIELLPSSAESIAVRQLLLDVDRAQMADAVRCFAVNRSWESLGPIHPFPHIAITAGSFPADSEVLLGRYLHEACSASAPELSRVLRFAALCILESISYTRKDGQYLRWDYRSGRGIGAKRFDKGRILGFTEAIVAKLEEIAADLSLSDQSVNMRATLFDLPKIPARRGHITLLEGSCLDILPTLDDSSFDGLVTSPPYCNRYDYTRTYALELALMGVGELGLRQLRQTMLSCTVENREKTDLADLYPADLFRQSTEAWSSQEVLTLVLSYLEACRLDGSLNNNGIPRMVRNYFAEMALVIHECARVLRPGAPLVMVNDNVRYQGAHIPVDLILSDIAQQAGFDVEAIWVLPRGKGNSSQQMGAHGREEIRKCVYIWRRATVPQANPQDQLLAVAR